MERWVSKSEVTSGVVAFLGPRDLFRLRLVSKASAELVDLWWKHLQIDLDPEIQFKHHGHSIDENQTFLDGLEAIVARGARIRSVVFASISATGRDGATRSRRSLGQASMASIPKRTLYDRILRRVAIVGLADHSLRSLIIRRNSRDVCAPWIQSLPCFTGLRRLHLDVRADINTSLTLRAGLIHCLRRTSRRLEELSFRPAVFTFSSSDFADLPQSLRRLELAFDMDDGIGPLESWLAVAGPRQLCTELRLRSHGGVRRLCVDRIADVFPNLRLLCLHHLSPRLDWPVVLHFGQLQSLSIHCERNTGTLDRELAADVAAFARAFSADSKSKLTNLELVGECQFADAAEFDALSELVGLQTLSLDFMARIGPRSLFSALPAWPTLGKLINLELLVVPLMCSGETVLWPQGPWTGPIGARPRSVRTLLAQVVASLAAHAPPGLRTLRLPAVETAFCNVDLSYNQNLAELDVALKASLRSLRGRLPRERLSLELATAVVEELASTSPISLATVTWLNDGPRFTLAASRYDDPDPTFRMAFD